MKTISKSVSYQEDLILFFNRFLNLEANDSFLISLVERLTKYWVEKLEEEQERTEKFSNLDQEFFKFYESATLEINEQYDVIIDSYGSIIYFILKKERTKEEINNLYRNLNTNIFSFFALINEPKYKESFQQAENIILQNILVSKITKAIAEQLRMIDEITAARFILANKEKFCYDDNLKNSLDYEEQFKSKLIRSRSLR